MAYDLAGRLIRVSSPNHYNNGAPDTYTEYGYDDMDRRIAVREIVSGSPYSEETYAYDANGNLIQ